ncbi:MAG: hypothetical protein WBC19_10285 [Pyrinomonadaceae bacterium]|nr:hypothetical protein [Pyrinomonadaceae bacterium]
MKFAVLILTVFLAAVSAAGQVKKLTSAEFNAAMGSAFGASSIRPRREIKKSVTYEKGKVVQTSTVTEEFIPPYRSRSHFLSDIVGNKSEKEWVIVDGQRYTLSYVGGEWYRDSALPTYPSMTVGPDVQVETDKYTKYTSQKAKLLGKPVTILKRVETSRPGALWGTTTYIVYVGAEAAIVRIEQKNVESGKGNYTNELTTYEYNPKGLKIEAPIK